jgi:4-aminobutyrate aminotransferase-like enzyme
MLPKIMTPLPGPEAKKVLEKDQRFISQSYTRVYPLVVKRAEGVWVEDVDSNQFLDFTSGIAVCNTGHCHPRIVAAIQRQAEQLIHMSGTDFYYEAQSRLAEKLAGITHVPYAYCYRCPSHSSYPGCGCACVDWIREDLFKRSLPPEEVLQKING